MNAVVTQQQAIMKAGYSLPRVYIITTKDTEPKAAATSSTAAPGDSHTLSYSHINTPTRSTYTITLTHSYQLTHLYQCNRYRLYLAAAAPSSSAATAAAVAAAANAPNIARSKLKFIRPLRLQKTDPPVQRNAAFEDERVFIEVMERDVHLLVIGIFLYHFSPSITLSPPFRPHPSLLSPSVFTLLTLHL